MAKLFGKNCLVQTGINKILKETSNVFGRDFSFPPAEPADIHLENVKPFLPRYFITP